MTHGPTAIGFLAVGSRLALLPWTVAQGEPEDGWHEPFAQKNKSFVRLIPPNLKAPLNPNFDLNKRISYISFT